MTTPLPSRLRESARLLRGLYLYSENQTVKLIDKADSTRIAAELTEAADALEAGPWMPIETAPKDKALLTHDGVSYNLAHFNTALGKWIANHPYDERLPREPIRWTLLPPHPRSGTAAQVAQEGGGMSASAYLAKIEAAPRRAAALQRARDRAAGVATRHPRCGYPYCACVGECFAASQPGVTAGVLASDNWQQYSKEGETAQACIERHRREQDALLKLLAQARQPLKDEEIIALLPPGWTGMLAQVMEFARRIEAARGVKVGAPSVPPLEPTP